MAKLIDITGKALSGEWGTDDETGDGIPVLRTTNFTNEGVVDYTDVVTRTITKKNLDEKFLRSGDIIIEKSGGSDKQPVGRVIYFEGPANTYLFNNFTGLLRVKDQDAWYPRYIFYSLFANYKRGGTRAFENKTTGLHNLKTDDYVSRYEVVECDKEEQISICDKLDKLYSVIKARQQELHLLDDLIKARFVELFGLPLVNDKCWDIKLAGEICSITDGSHFSPEGIEEGYPMLSVRNMRNDGFHYDDCKKVSRNDYEILVKQGCKPLKNDVLIAKDGSYFYYGFVVNEEIEQAILSSIAILRPNMERVLPEYLCKYMLSKEIVELVGRNYVTGAAIKRVILKGIKQIPVMLPPLEEQKKFVKFVKQTDKSKVAVQKALDEVQLLFDSLMQKYFG